MVKVEADAFLQGFMKTNDLKVHVPQDKNGTEQWQK